jgi:thiol-disulfide isomerase/thioredoxin
MQTGRVARFRIEPSHIPKCLLLLVSSLVLTSSALVPMAFTSLESSVTQKIVLFHDPHVETSMQKLGVLESLDSIGTYGTEYQYTVCDITSAENIEPVKKVGLKDFPMIFVQTVEAGIEPFDGDFTVESFAAFHAVRKMDVTDHKVQRVKDKDGVGDVDGVAGLLKLAADRPVFLKAFESWCGHCKKMARDFKLVSNRPVAEINNVVLVEAECSKLADGFCGDLGVTGFPTVVLIFNGKWMKYSGARKHVGMVEFLGDKSKWNMDDLPAELAKYVPVSAPTISGEEVVSSNDEL